MPESGLRERKDMAQREKRSRKYFSAGFIDSSLFYCGTGSLALTQWLLFFQALGRGAVGASVGRGVCVLITLLPCLLQTLRRVGGCRMNRGNYYAVIHLGTVVMGLPFLIPDCISLAAGISIPILTRMVMEAAAMMLAPLLLWRADKRRTDPDGSLLLIAGLGGIALALLCTVFVFLPNGAQGKPFPAILPMLRPYIGCVMLSAAANIGLWICRAMSRMLAYEARVQRPRA